MTESTVQISMRDENDLNCNYAIITKDTISVIVILKDLECAVFNYSDLQKIGCVSYLLLKHYKNTSCAYTDFLKLTGKMCKKHKDSKYFSNRIIEDNRIIFDDFNCEHGISEEERLLFEARYSEFINFVSENKSRF